MAALFSSPKVDKPPELSDKEIEEARRKRLQERQGKGISATILTRGVEGLSDPVLGNAASLVGGIL